MEIKGRDSDPQSPEVRRGTWTWSLETNSLTGVHGFPCGPSCHPQRPGSVLWEAEGGMAGLPAQMPDRRECTESPVPTLSLLLLCAHFSRLVPKVSLTADLRAPQAWAGCKALGCVGSVMSWDPIQT